VLINFSVYNWMSFREKASFSMIASKERKHGKRLPRVKKYGMRILPVSALYGGNASGKTNFFKALSFAKKLVVDGTKGDEEIIQVEPFCLDASCEEAPSGFYFELLVDEVVYEFSFTITRKTVVSEKLVCITASSEKTLYERKEGKANFHGSLKDKERLNFAFEGTRDNQLFLTNSVSQKVGHFRPIHDWFKHTLELISPNSYFFPLMGEFLEEGNPLSSAMNTALPLLDTGIGRIDGEEIAFENLPLSEPDKSKLKIELSDESVFSFSWRNEYFVVSRAAAGKLTVKKLFTYHRKTDGSEEKFEIRDESDGSRRVIELLPAFVDLSSVKLPKVYVIDELDRSLHTLLTRKLLESYLESCSEKTRSQLLFTTHDVLLMDQNLLRRDEMWVTERNIDGGTSLLSFSDYKDIRYDKDIRKSYLQGRLGGIPKILLSGAFQAGDDVCESEKT